MDSSLGPLDVVAAWLDGAGAEFASRALAREGEVAAWEICLRPAAPTGSSLRLGLPTGFPEVMPRLAVAKDNFLRYPHIERDGRICLADEIIAERDSPQALVIWVLKRFEEFAMLCADPQWVEAEFRRDALAHWRHFCDEMRKGSSRGRCVEQVYLDLAPLNSAQRVGVAAYGKIAIVSALGNPENLAARHGFAAGQLTRGEALLVPLHHDFGWSPSAWPRTHATLDAMLHALTGKGLETQFREGRGRGSARTRLVIFLQDGAAFAYQVVPSPIPAIPMSDAHPIMVRRIDAPWALFRDYMPATARAAQRVLLLGCGSLGSAIAEALARAGVGELHLVDPELFESENTARHSLGLGEMLRYKAAELEKRILRAVPGIKVRHTSLSADWALLGSNFEPYDLIVDCTGDWRVREKLGQLTADCVGEAGIAHAWMEPFAAAAHVAAFSRTERWPSPEFVDRIQLCQWGHVGTVRTTGCSADFSPYGAAECLEVAGFASRCLLQTLDVPGDTVIWSWTRAREYFHQHGGTQVSSLVPAVPGMRSTSFTRRLEDIVNGA